jgi:DNA-directed RNA polymerase subunit RPC12/RpoP
MSSENSSEKRSSVRAHSSYDSDIYRVVHSGKGWAIQCQYCSGQSFRRSRLRANDIAHLLLMRYPVRCLRCSQRQMVSFTVAGISVPSHVKQRRARHEVAKL